MNGEQNSVWQVGVEEMRNARKGLRLMGITKTCGVGEGGGKVGILQGQVEKSASASRWAGETEGLGQLGWWKDEESYLWLLSFSQRRMKQVHLWRGESYIQAL